MDALLVKHLKEHSKGLREVNNLFQAKSSQIRSEKNKQIHDCFFTDVLPQINNTDSKKYNSVIKSLSKIYRNKDVDVATELNTIRNTMTGASSPHALGVNEASPLSPKKKIPAPKKTAPLKGGSKKQPVAVPRSPRSEQIVNTLALAIQEYLENHKEEIDLEQSDYSETEETSDNE